MTLRVAEKAAASRFLFARGRQQSLWISVVAEGAAQVDEDVPISWAEKEAGAQLEKESDFHDASEAGSFRDARESMRRIA
jgi:hypothetical protein